MSGKPATAVSVDLRVFAGNVDLILSATGVPSVPITIDPQQAFDLAEKLARAAHEARFGVPAKSDHAYLAERVREKITAEYRQFLVRRFEIMLNSTRDNGAVWPNARLAAELVDTILTKVA